MESSPNRWVNGLALTILVGQLPKLFGFSTDADGLINGDTLSGALATLLAGSTASIQITTNQLQQATANSFLLANGTGLQKVHTSSR